MTHAPIRVITVEREYGSRGGEFAHDLAAHLGWRLLDSELPCAAARAAGVSAGAGQPSTTSASTPGITATARSSGTTRATPSPDCPTTRSSTPSACWR